MLSSRYEMVRVCANKRITKPLGIVKHIQEGLGPDGTMHFSVQEKVVNYSPTIATGDLTDSRWELFGTEYHDECSCVHLADIMKHLDMPVWEASRSIYLQLDEYDSCSLYILSQEIKARFHCIHCTHCTHLTVAVRPSRPTMLHLLQPEDNSPYFSSLVEDFTSRLKQWNKMSVV